MSFSVSRLSAPPTPARILPTGKWPSLSVELENAPPRLRPLSGGTPSTAGGTPTLPGATAPAPTGPVHPPYPEAAAHARSRATAPAPTRAPPHDPYAIALRSASTMIFTRLSNFVCGSQPSLAFALSKLPMSKSTSAGRS